MKNKLILIAGLFLGITLNVANAVPVPCDVVSTTINYMEIGDAQVSACLDSGFGNINGNPMQDEFLQGVGAGYELISKDDAFNPFNIGSTQGNTAYGSAGTWEFDATAWDAWANIAIGFKFGTGQDPDNWFVFSVVNGEFEGIWDFFEATTMGGQGLSHINLYGMDSVSVPEPGTLALLGTGLLLMVARRRKSIK